MHPKPIDPLMAALLRRPVSSWTKAEVEAVMSSPFYQDPHHPQHQEVFDRVKRWFEIQEEREQDPVREPGIPDDHSRILPYPYPNQAASPMERASSSQAGQVEFHRNITKEDIKIIGGELRRQGFTEESIQDLLALPPSDLQQFVEDHVLGYQPPGLAARLWNAFIGILIDLNVARVPKQEPIGPSVGGIRDGKF